MNEFKSVDIFLNERPRFFFHFASEERCEWPVCEPACFEKICIINVSNVLTLHI